MSAYHSFTRASVWSIDLVSGESFTPAATPPVPAPRRAHIVIRLHDHPIGLVEVDAENQNDYLDVVRKFAWEELRDEINEHLEADGLARPESIEDLGHIAPHCIKALNEAPDNAPFITVSVATVGNQDACLRTVERILESTYPKFEIVIVDNTPGDSNLGDVVKNSITDERVRYAHETRKGLSFARNRGLAEAHGEVVVFTDDDVLTDPGWLFAIGRAFASDTKVACVTGAILAAEIETPAQAWLEQYGGYNKGFRTQVYDLEENRRNTPLYPYDSGRFGSGANIALKSSVLRDMGAFSTDLGAGTPAHGGEDIDILRRVVTDGHRLVYEPSALLWHHHRRSYVALRTQMYRYGVGLSATVTRWIITDPRTALEVARRIPVGAKHIFSPNSKKNENKTTHYPSQLTWLERIGFALGPLLYLKSRIVVRGRK